MKTEVSKSQIEVWEIREKLYEKIKHLSPSQQIKALIEMAKPVIEELKNYKKKKQKRFDSILLCIGYPSNAVVRVLPPKFMNLKTK